MNARSDPGRRLFRNHIECEARIVTNAEMGRLDARAQRFGLSGATLMENAGRGAADVLESYFDLQGLRVLVVCGRGNNGGDGFVVARHLKNRGSEASGTGR